MTLWTSRSAGARRPILGFAARRDCKADSNLRVESRSKPGCSPPAAIHVKRAFVIGHPIAHSRSPLIHGYWLKTYGIDGSYEAIDVTPEALPDFFRALESNDFSGGNVTIPHKQMVYSLVDNLDPLAEEIGAVNTIIRRGGLYGMNTDYMGFLGNLDHNAPGWDKGLEEAIVLGAGGACRAIVVALKGRNVKHIHLLNRTAAKAEEVAIDLEGPIQAGALGDFPARAKNARLVVNTSAVGMKGTHFDDLDLGVLAKDALVTDIVYTPLVTPLLADAQAHGLKTVDGLGMLLHQAVPGFEAWFGTKPEVTPELRAVVEASL
jgi:shikimate dehydrogenase